MGRLKSAERGRGWWRGQGSVDEAEVGAGRRAETTSIVSVAQDGQD